VSAQIRARANTCIRHYRINPPFCKGGKGDYEEVQDSSCRGFGGVPQISYSPKSGGHRGLKRSSGCLLQIAERMVEWRSY
jgi:hypothetical protein